MSKYYTNVAASSTSYTLDNGATITETIAKEKQTYYDYEVEVNEAKREINLLNQRPSFKRQSVRELLVKPMRSPTSIPVEIYQSNPASKV